MIQNSFLKNGYSSALFSLLSSFQQLTVNIIKLCRLLDLNNGSLVLEATALPTEPQLLNKILYGHTCFITWTIGMLLLAPILESVFVTVKMKIELDGKIGSVSI